MTRKSFYEYSMFIPIAVPLLIIFFEKLMRAKFFLSWLQFSLYIGIIISPFAWRWARRNDVNTIRNKILFFPLIFVPPIALPLIFIAGLYFAAMGAVMCLGIGYGYVILILLMEIILSKLG